VVMFVTHMES